MKYAAITVFSAAGSNILNFIHARSYCRIKLVWHFNWKVHLTPILIIFGANIANMIYVNSDITLLGLMKNDYIVGLYSVSSKVYQIVKTLIAALLIVTIPRLAMLFGKNRIKEYKSILSSLTNTLVLIALPASVGLVMLSKEIVLLISGERYIKATNSLAILSLAYIFSILAWILTDCVLIPSKREKYVLRSMGSSAILNVLLNIILIPPMNEDAAALSTVLAEMCMFIVNYHYAKDLVSDIFTSRKFFKNLMDSFVGCIGIVIVCLLCRWGWNSAIMMTISSIFLSVVIYGAILVLVGNEIVFFWLKKVKEIINKKV